MPAYNCATTVVSAVESIVSGNFDSGDEVIVVDDCSIDRTREVLMVLAEKYPFLKIIYNSENKGCPASRNIGIEKSRNSLIFNLDSDNILVSASVRRLKRLLLDVDADMAAFGEIHFFLHENGTLTHKWVFDRGRITLADSLAGYYSPGPAGNFLYTKESWERIGRYYEFGAGLHEAWGFTLKQLANGATFVTLPKSYYLHRHGHESLYVRETAQSPSASSLVATRMIEPFLTLLHPDDAAYIQSDAGRVSWFDNLNERPIRLKSGEVGKTGRVVMVRHPYKRMLRLASKLWRRSA